MAEPKLRFRREDGTNYPEWKNIIFAETFSPLNNNTFSRDMLSDNGEVYNIHYGDILVKFGEVCDIQSAIIPKVNVNIDTSKFDKLRDGDIIIADTAEDETVGKAIEIYHVGNNKVVSGLHTMACRPNIDFFPKYLGYYINSPSYHNQLIPFMQGIKVTSIGRKNIADTIICFPKNLEEQQKIADFLTTIDEVIAQSEAEVQNLEQQKKAAMQKIFSQEVRFKREDGTEFPKWETVALGEIVEPNIIPVDNPRSNYVKLAVRSHCKGTFHKQITNESDGLDIDKMFLVEANNLIVNITFAWEHAIAITKPEDNGTYVSHRFPQYKFINNNLPSFYEYVIKKPKMKYEMGLCSPGGAGRNRVLNQKDFMKILMVRPCPEEQQKIADFLSAYDEAITYAKHELDKWKELKKGLLQQMFV
ncbi:MAG: restriction endonuclease subunit S [Oscillospiraceae bacterium]|nr:restriction endonuclease subunit S [Oscillospiraceae bacterium]